MIMNFIEQLETKVNWNRVFGVVDSLYSDNGFTSNADNFARATMVEKALDKFSAINRVDQNGYEFEWEDKKIELFYTETVKKHVSELDAFKKSQIPQEFTRNMGHLGSVKKTKTFLEDLYKRS